MIIHHLQGISLDEVVYPFDDSMCVDVILPDNRAVLTSKAIVTDW